MDEAFRVIRGLDASIASLFCVPVGMLLRVVTTMTGGTKGSRRTRPSSLQGSWKLARIMVPIGDESSSLRHL